MALSVVASPSFAAKKKRKQSSQQEIICEMPNPVEINVVPKTKDVRFDFTQTIADIQGNQVDTINPYGFHQSTRTQGFMKGAISIRPSIKLGGEEFRSAQGSGICLWYEVIQLNIEIDPQIVIAKEVYDDPCTRKAVLDHEMKHVYADREIVNKYASVMGKRVYEALKQRGFTVGPIPASSQKNVTNRMHETVIQVIKKEQRRMELDREDLQGEIDSIEEYNRVSALCEKPTEKPKSYSSKKRSRYSR